MSDKKGPKTGGGTPFEDDDNEKSSGSKEQESKISQTKKKRRRRRPRKKTSDEIKKEVFKGDDKGKIEGKAVNSREKPEEKESEDEELVKEKLLEEESKPEGQPIEPEQPVDTAFPAFGGDGAAQVGGFDDPVVPEVSSEPEMPVVAENPFAADSSAGFGAPLEAEMPAESGFSPEAETPAESGDLSEPGMPNSKVDNQYNVPHQEDEHRYDEATDTEESEFDKSVDDSSFKSGEKEPEKQQESPEQSMSQEEPQPFAAPPVPDTTSPLEEKSFDKKPLDEVGQTSSMPEKVPESPEDKFAVVEDKETDEQTDAVTDDNFGGKKEPPHKEIKFEEGAAMEYEQNDPLTDKLGVAPKESVQDVAPVDEFSATPGDPSVIGVTEVADVTPAGDFDEDKGGFWELLEEAGIRKQHVFMVLGVLGVVVVIILFFVFGGYKLFVSDGDSKPSVSVTKETETQSESQSQPESEETKSETLQEGVVPASYDQVFGLSGLVNSYIFGLEFSQYKILPGLNLTPVSGGGSTVGIDSSLAVGQSEGVTRDTITYYIDLLRQIDNVRQVNLYDYLNQFVDRRAALQEHLSLLGTLLLDSEASKNAILQEMARIDAEYTAVSDEKDVYETNFFDSLNSLQGESSYGYLELFVESSQKKVKQKAYYNAFKSLNDSFDAAIGILGPRIEDISVNADALIRGVKVFEVPGSNIDAIIIQNSLN